jgi:hypothetical protein
MFKKNTRYSVICPFFFSVSLSSSSHAPTHIRLPPLLPGALSALLQRLTDAVPQLLSIELLTTAPVGK